MKSQFIYNDGSPIELMDNVVTESGRRGKVAEFDTVNDRALVKIALIDADGEPHRLWYSPNALRKHVKHSLKVKCLC